VDMELDNQIRVEWVILADHAEVVGGKLYLVGGGWDTIALAPGSERDYLLSLAVSLRVPWNQTNERHDLRIVVEDQDGKELASLGGQFEVGRPAGIPAGHPQRFQMAVNHLSITFEAAGAYAVVVSVNGRLDPFARTPFFVR